MKDKIYGKITLYNKKTDKIYGKITLYSKKTGKILGKVKLLFTIKRRIGNMVK